MTAAELIKKLESLDIRVHSAEGKLRIDAPRGALSSDLVDDMRALKTELLSLVEGRAVPVGATARATYPARLEEQNEFPLSLAQHAFYMLEQMDPQPGAYNLFSARRIRLPLDAQRFALSVDNVIRRHEPLRTRFALRERGPVQVVENSAPLCFSFEDWSSLAPAERESKLESLLARSHAHALRLDAHPLLRIRLVRLGESEHVLTVALHHIIGDARSLDLLYEELLSSYNELSRGASCSLPDLAVQYADFANAQRERLARGELEPQISFWTEQLRDLPALALGRARADHDNPTARSHTLVRTLSAPTCKALAATCRELKVSSFTVLLGAFKLLLARSAASDDVSVITPVSGRTLPELDRMIGLFVSTVVVRTKVRATATGADFLRAIKTNVASALEHQEVSLEVLEGVLRQRRDKTVALERVPRIAFNHLHAVRSGREHASDTMAAAVERLDTERERAAFDLMMIVTETTQETALKLEYREDRFDAHAATRLLEHYEALLGALCRAPLAALSELGTQSPDECTKLARDVGYTNVDLRPLSPSERARYEARELAGHEQARVYAQQLHRDSKDQPEISLEAALKELMTAEPLLRSRVVRPSSPLAQDVMVATAESGWDATAHIRRSAPGRAIELTVRDAAAELAAASCTLEWLVVAPPSTAGDELWLLARETAIDGKRLAILTEGLRETLGGTGVRRAPASAIAALAHTTLGSTRATPDVTRAQLGKRLGETAIARAEGLSLAALRAALEPCSEELVEQRHSLAAGQLSELESYCASQALDLDGLLRIAFGTLAGSYGRAEGAFQISIVDERGPEPSSHFLAFPAPAASGDTREALVRSVRLLSAADVSTLTGSHTFSGNELDYVWISRAEPLECPTQRVFPPANQVVVQAHQREQGLELSVAYLRGAQPDDNLLERIVSIALQLARGTTQAADLVLLLPRERDAYAPAPLHPPLRPNLDLSELARAWAERDPERIAVRAGERALTYRELDERSSRLARLIVERGCTPGRVVAVLLPRSERLLVALLAILKSGCAYLPLDPRYPAARVQTMLERSNAALILTASELEHLLPVHGLDVLRFDQAWPELDQLEPLSCAAPDGSETAYVIFTSGSTGAPKGVSVPRAAMLSFLDSMAREPGLCADDVLLAVTTIAFDISVLELFLPLYVGACVAIADEATAVDGARLLEALRAHRVTALQATPHTWQLLLEAGLRDATTLKALCGGEAMPPSLAERLRPEVQSLWNMYGPTEATVWVTAHRVADQGQPIPIGKPIAGVALYVLDRARRLVPPGVLGELHIAGRCLADGYVGDLAQTESRFVRWRTPAGDTTLVYRTGDRGRLAAEGMFHCLGRIDRQIKLRGHRIELAEIECALRAQKGVAEAVVTLEHADTSDARLSAYVQSDGDHGTSERALRAALKESLPPYSVPQRIVLVEGFPRLANGKLDLGRLAQLTPRVVGELALPSTSLETKLLAIWEAVIGARGFGVRDNFFDVGGHSLLLLQVQRRIEAETGTRLDVVDLFTHGTIEKLAKHLERKRKPIVSIGAARPSLSPASSGDVAIIGMSCVFPGASDLKQLWRNLRAGTESITLLDRETLAQSGVPLELLDHPSYVRAAAVVPDVESFDATLFRFTPREAQLLDPQHRLLLQCAYAALEDAACDPTSTTERVGVFAGVGFSYYLLQRVLTQPDSLARESPLELLYGNDKDYAATRLAYKLNLRGPSLSVGTACSTGLVAVHQACRSLFAGECEVALAGAARIAVPQARGYLRAEGGILSPDGHCRAFDARAEGTLFGNGVGVVVLKRLEHAVRDGNSIYCVVKGSAINNDGNDKVGFTAPSKHGQAQVLRDAYRAAGISPGDVQYVEAHGTGTRLGDAIEIAALNEAFCSERRPEHPIALGSIKTNFGHLDTAAGIAGLIKAALALHHREIPPTVHFESANPALGLERTPFYVNDRVLSWPETGTPMRAGVSSFGIGGTNAHVVLEAFSAETEPRAAVARPELLVVSAATAQALQASAGRLAEQLARGAEDLGDVAHTLRVGRPAHAFRAFRVATQTADAARALAELRDADAAPDSTPALLFAMPGQSAAHSGMARGLYEREPLFRARLDEALALASELMGVDFHASVLAKDPVGPLEVLHVQPALFALELALFELWSSWGVVPDMLLGHSLGELAAAAAAGVFTREDGMRAVVARARAIHACGEGRMVAALAGAEQVATSLAPGCAIAAFNAPDVTVLSGSLPAVLETQKRLAARAIRVRPLAGERAFHSEAMDPALPAIREAFGQIALRAPKIRMLSTVTGTWLTDEQALSPSYWASQVREPVRFADAVSTALTRAPLTALELGPGGALTILLGRRLSAPSRALAMLPDAQHVERAVPQMLSAAGELWRRGHPIDWSGFRDARAGVPRRVHLPTYPFARDAHWYPTQSATDLPRSRLERTEVDQWTYEPAFRRKSLPAAAIRRCLGTTLIVADQRSEALAEIIASVARERGEEALLVHKAESALSGSGTPHVAIAADDPDAYVALLAQVTSPVKRILHLWCLERSADAAVRRTETFFSLLSLAQALSRDGRSDGVEVLVVTDALHAVRGDEQIDPDQSLALGAARTLARELSGMRVSVIDVEHDADQRRTACALFRELDANLPDLCAAYRGRFRWVESFERVLLEPPAPATKDAPVVLITGAAGALGHELAQHFAHSRGARLVLLATHWDALRTARVAALREVASELVCESADITCRASVAAVLERTYARFGRLDALFHVAGCADGKLAVFQDRPHAERVLAPKVDGARLLSELLLERELGHLVLFSSVTAVTGDPGQLAYCAANCYLDALAESNRARGLKTTAIDWDTWSETGMAVRAQVAAALRPVQAERLRLGIKTQEGLALLDRMLRSAPTRLTVSTVDLPTRLGRIQSDVSTAALAREANLRHSVSGGEADPRPLIERIRAAWCDSFGLAEIELDADFFALGGSSLQAVGLAEALQRTLGVRVHPDALLRHPSIRELTAELTRAAEAPSQGAHTSRTLVRLRAGNERHPPLFLVHPVGGEVFVYRELSRQLPKDLTVYGIRQERPGGSHSVEEAASAYLSSVREVCPDGPYLLGGSSFGGTVAFEMAQQVRAAGQRVPALLMIDTPDGSQVEHAFADDADVLAYLASHLPASAGLAIDTLRSVPEADLLSYFLARAVDAGLSERFDRASLRDYIDTFRANDRAMRAYRPKAYAGPVVYVKARERRARYDPLQPELLWRSRCSQLELLHTPGDHLTMHEPPHVTELAAVLSAPLSRAMSACSTALDLEQG